MGDIPFLVSKESADVWIHADLFPEGDLVGAPPDDFNAEGQPWGFPHFSFLKMKETDFQWWRQRIRFARGLYDMIRLDHVVGFFRTWVFPKEGNPYFDPGREASQKERGQQFLELFLSEARDVMLVAEDLGVIPQYVTELLYKMHIPGMKIIRWQKREDQYLHPKIYPWLSLATTGTHDTTPAASWWNELAVSERSSLLAMVDKTHTLSPEIHFSEKLRQLMVGALFSGSSAMAILPFQDILGLPDQINQPGTISDQNWRYRMPENIESLCDSPLYKEKIAFLKTTIEKNNRGGIASLVMLRGY